MKAKYVYVPKTKYFDIVQYLSGISCFMTFRSTQKASWWKDILKNYPVFIAFLAFNIIEWYFRRNAENDQTTLFGDKNILVGAPSSASQNQN